MDSKSLPTKAAHDARHEPILREGLAKDERSAEQLVGQRAHLPGKAAFDERHAAQDDKSATHGGEQPPHRPVDQQPPERGGARGGGGEYYVRLTVRVDDGVLSIVDSHTVDGPLAQTTAFHGPFAYEVTDGGRLLHAGSITDLGMVRAFADPEGTPEQHRHHSYQQTSYEFDVRVPAAALREAALSNVAIILHRVKAPDHIGTRASSLAEVPLTSQRGEAFREIGRVVGIPVHLLTPDLHRDQPTPAAERTRGFKSRPPQREGDRKGEDGETSE